MTDNLSLFKNNLDKVCDHVRNDIASLRTGKANAALLDLVSVEAYGSYMKVNELANITVPDANMLIVTPWDKSVLGAIETAINKAELNLNPVVDGDKIRIVVPALTQERRQEMVKLLHQKIESGKVMIRNERTDTKKMIEAQKGEAAVSEDDIKLELTEMQKIVDQYIEKLEEIAEVKEKELMTI